jgi:3-oxoacyl-[acyl-carrier protein] reductase
MSIFDLTGKTAIVTGGAGGIGIHVAIEYAKAGAKVVVASRNLENLNQVVDKIDANGGQSLAIEVDITDSEQVDNMIAQTVDKFGSLDVIVNSAGRWGKSYKPEDTPIDEWHSVVDLNLTGTFLCCLAAGRQMIKQRSGKIINVSSTAGTKGNPGQLHYSAAKAGVLSLTNNLAMMWAGHNINVNCIIPGLIATEELKGYKIIPSDTNPDGTRVSPLDLPPKPENVADLALFLASEASDSITGEEFPIRTWFKSDRYWQQ